MGTGITVLGIFGVVLLCGGGVLGYSYMSGHMGNMRNMSHMGAMGGTTTGTTRETTLVLMRNVAFDPQVAQVRLGDTVTWRNDDTVAHTVTSDDARGPLDSPTLAPGATWSFTFTQAGTFGYHCEPHSSQAGDGRYQGMVASVVVS